METILLIAQTPQNAYQAVSYICEDIKADHNADHKLYFARILFGGFHISKGEVHEENGVKMSTLTGEHELIIFPAAYEDQLEKLKVDKSILLLKNCMTIAGDSSKKIAFRKSIIEWLLDDDKKWDYANVDIGDS